MYYYKMNSYDKEILGKIYSSETKLEKEQVVVISDSYDCPVTAYTTERVEEYVALASDYEVEPIITIVDLKEYKKRIEAKNKRALVLKKMQEKMSEVKLIESLKKCAEKDDEMRALFKEFQSTLKTSEEDEEDRL